MKITVFVATFSAFISFSLMQTSLSLCLETKVTIPNEKSVVFKKMDDDSYSCYLLGYLIFIAGVIAPIAQPE